MRHVLVEVDVVGIAEAGTEQGPLLAVLVGACDPAAGGHEAGGETVAVRVAGKEKVLATGPKLLQRANFSGDSAALRFRTPKALNPPGAYYQVVEAGFDRKLADKPLTEGIEVYRELLDKSNKPVTTTQLGEVITVRLHIRGLRPDLITNVALVDLLPGGFEVVTSSLTPGISSIKGVDYVEVREDRAIFYASIPTETLEIIYQIKSANRGTFVVPPVFAESMYDRNLKGRGLGGKITVTK